MRYRRTGAVTPGPAVRWPSPGISRGCTAIGSAAARRSLGITVRRAGSGTVLTYRGLRGRRVRVPRYGRDDRGSLRFLVAIVTTVAAATAGCVWHAAGTRWARLSRAVKWTATVVAAVVVKLPFLPKTERDRWVVAAAFATVMTGLVTVCGGWWAGRENRPESADSDTGGAGQQITGSPGSIQAGPGARMKMRDVTIVNPTPVPPGRDEAGHPKA